MLEGLEPVRRRPGMYIGGTDEKAMHHLFSEVMDNSMDEAVAGHADWIEVELDKDGMLTVTDNGRGIPVDPHPKFRDKSALEVIMTTLHSGGKFDSKVYETSGGLHGVGVSVVNALSDKLEVEVARDRKLYRQSFARGKPTSKLKEVGDGPQPPRHEGDASTPTRRFSARRRAFDPDRLFRMARSKAYLFGGVEIRWTCAPSLIPEKSETPAKAVFHFPGGLKDYLAESLTGETLVGGEIFSGRSSRQGGHGSVEWAIAWFAGDGFARSYCNTITTPEGGTHEAGLRSVLLRGFKAYADLTGNKRAAVITSDDIMTSCGAMLSVFLREPEFVGQTKDRLASVEAIRIVENAMRDAFDHWLAASPNQRQPASRMGDRARRGAAAPPPREGDRAQDRDAKAPPSRQARRLQLRVARGHRALHRRGRFRRRLRQAGARPPHPGDPAAARQDPERRQRRARKARSEPAALRSAAGARLRHRRALPRGGPALRQGHHHDRRRRRRRAHRLAAHHLLLSRAAGAHPTGPPLSRGASPLPPRAGPEGVFTRATTRIATSCLKTEFAGRGKVEISRFKGLGEMPMQQLRDTTMDPAKRTLLQVGIVDDEDEAALTKTMVQRLMGNKPEERFAFIQERAAFASEELIDV